MEDADEAIRQGADWGPRPLVNVLGGVAGALMAGVAARLRSGSGAAGPVAVDTALIGDHADLLHLLRELPELAGLERWLACHVV